MYRRGILFARFVACMGDTRLPKRAENWWGARAAWGLGKRVDEVSRWTILRRAFGINADQWTMTIK